MRCRPREKKRRRLLWLLVDNHAARVAGRRKRSSSAYDNDLFVELAHANIVFHIDGGVNVRDRPDGRSSRTPLEVREQHQLITKGIYRRIRHPMHSALALYAIGQALLIPNWVAGPSNLIAFAILFLLRVRAEERMMA